MLLQQELQVIPASKLSLQQVMSGRFLKIILFDFCWLYLNMMQIIRSLQGFQERMT